MSQTFTKLFSGLTESTVWVEPYPTRILWVSMLSWADPRGRIFGSLPGIARRAGINIDEAEAALVSFMSPDRHSRTPDNEGRRIEKIDGGWRLLNYTKYRELRDAEVRREQNREAQRAHRDRIRASAELLTGADNADNKPRSAQEEEEEEEENTKPTVTVGQTPPDGVLPGLELPPTAKAERHPRDVARDILAFLNEKTGRAYKPVDANLELIVARLREGYSARELRQIVAKKCREWQGREDMAEYLRPATLFNRKNCAQYTGELVVPKEEPNA